MCIVFTCGEHTFRKNVEGYEGLVCRCYNCGNYSGSVIKSNPWFTFCFVVSQVLFNSAVPCSIWPRLLRCRFRHRPQGGCLTPCNANPTASLDSP